MFGWFNSNRNHEICCKIVAFSYLHGLALCFFMCLFNWLENVQEYVAAQMKGFSSVCVNM